MLDTNNNISSATGSVFAVAPMMDWTDRHCRYFHRQLSRRAVLFTEMITADAIIHGDRDALLHHHPCEDPLVLQIGGSDPEKLALTARIAAEFGYKEINLNVGCPSGRVQSGAFGACLMREPDIVGRCVAAMKSAADIRVSVKCRIGVDNQDTGPALDMLAQAIWREGCSALWVHARKAWLNGLNPKANRDIPPLDYDRVRKLKQDFPCHFIGLNGGLKNLVQAHMEIAGHETKLDGAMLGRAAYQMPGLLCEVDSLFYGDEHFSPNWNAVIEAMCAYAEVHLSRGGRLNQITRHMIGLFHGMPGARRWRQILSIEASTQGAGPEVIRNAFNEIGSSNASPEFQQFHSVENRTGSVHALV
jgi:tRNA-dihydrouridine synthase A